MASEMIGRYEILSELGRGGMAIVFLANDPSTKRQVAIKVLPRQFTHDPQFRARFLREAEVIAQLEHAAIVPLYDFGEHEEQPYIVMRYMTGGSLADRLEQGPLSVADATSIIERIASGLEKGHAQGIVHRDLKPGNILFDEDGHAYLADYGIVKISESSAALTGSGIIGTPAYMSPEQVEAGAAIDGRSDLYSLGVILYQMLAGVNPYDAETPMKIVMQHLVADVPSILDTKPHLPQGIDAVIQRAMAKKPQDRFQNGGAMAQAMDAAARGDYHPPAQGEPSYATLPMDDTDVAPPGAAPAATQASRAGSKLSPLAIIGALVGGVVVVGAVLLATGTIETGGGTTDEESPATEPPTDQPASVAPETAMPETLAPLEMLAPTAISLVPTIVTAGQVEVKRVNGQSFQLLFSGQPIGVGDTIRTGADGVALLVFAAGVSAELQPGGQMSIVRMEEADSTLIIAVRQTSGTSYHFVTPDRSGGTGREYEVATPVGTVLTMGTEFWINERDAAWLFAPTDGSILFEVGGDDTNTADDYVAHARLGDCLLVDQNENVSPCTLDDSGLGLRSDGADILPQPTATVQFVAPVSTVPPAETPGTGVWGACGSCDSCGFNVEQCVLSPEGACLYDPSTCASSSGGGGPCAATGSSCTAASQCCTNICTSNVCG